MKAADRQRGASFWGWMVIIVVAVVFGTVALKSAPVYLNEMKIRRTVERVAEDPELAGAGVAQIRERLERFWATEDISRLQPKDVKLVRSKDGTRMLRYQYEVRVPLFLNVSLVYSFEYAKPLPRSTEG